jgi:predicted RNA binding protein YcfA (HicA-like mRNA interferase family)
MSEHIGELKDELPDLFKDLPLPNIDWDGHDIYDTDPNGTILDGIDIGGIIDEQGDYPIWPRDNINNGTSFPSGSRVGNNRAYGGSLQDFEPNAGAYPPPDCLAFYLPFHYYYHRWWGIYILHEGLEYLAEFIYKHARPRPDLDLAWKAAHIFLYYHEAFHHRTECFGTRFELIDRKPHYIGGFQDLFDKTYGTDECLEEALANATAAIEVSNKLNHSGINDALLEYMRGMPPGYRRADEFIEKSNFNGGRNLFSELNRAECYGVKPKKSTDFWSAVGYHYNGNTNINSRIHYLVPKGSPINRRIGGSRPAISPRRLEKKLKELVGLKHHRSGSRHEIYISDKGKIVPIPRHSKDLKKGLIMGILKELGIHMNWEQFQRI